MFFNVEIKGGGLFWLLLGGPGVPSRSRTGLPSLLSKTLSGGYCSAFIVCGVPILGRGESPAGGLQDPFFQGWSSCPPPPLPSLSAGVSSFSFHRDVSLEKGDSRTRLSVFPIQDLETLIHGEEGASGRRDDGGRGGGRGVDSVRPSGPGPQAAGPPATFPPVVGSLRPVPPDAQSQGPPCPSSPAVLPVSGPLCSILPAMLPGPQGVAAPKLARVMGCLP